MVAIDHFSMIAIAIPKKAVNGQAMCKFMITIVGHLGPYRRLVVDVRQYFAGNAFGHFLNTRGVKRHETAGSHPEANKCCERFVRTFLQSLAKLGANSIYWNYEAEET
jgi:hypothetical protein